MKSVTVCVWILHTYMLRDTTWTQDGYEETVAEVEKLFGTRRVWDCI